MIQNEFYLTLPSNVNNPENEGTVSNYKTILCKRFEFPSNENWKVGLSEITFVKTWYNLHQRTEIQFFTKEGKDFRPDQYERAFEVKRIGESRDDVEIGIHFEESISVFTKPGYYDNISSLIVELNSQMSTYLFCCSKAPRLFYDDIEKKVTLHPGETIIETTIFYPFFGGEIERILGLRDFQDLGLFSKTILANEKTSVTFNETAVNAFNNGVYKGERVVDISAGVSSLLIYTNIIEHSYVGDTYAQLLRAVPVKSNTQFGDVINSSFTDPHLIPLQAKTFDTIEIDIRDDSGENIKFEGGRVIIKLIFRKYG